MKLIITDIVNFNIPVSGEYKLLSPATGEPKNCIGCFGCWTRTPGKCVICDGFEGTGITLGKCDELILISECVYGSFSPFVKAVLDRAISYVHPDFVTRNGEMHHKRRYDNVLSISAYLYGEDVTEAEKETMRNIVKGNTTNFDGKVKRIEFFNTAAETEGLTL